MPHPLPRVLSELLIRSADQFPAHGVGVVRADHSIHFQRYPELLDQAKRLLAGCNKKGISRGDKVILSLTDCEQIIPSVWACFLGGIVPVLLQPPVSFTGYNPAAEKARRIFTLLENPWVLLSYDHLGSWSGSGVPGERLIDISALSFNHPVAVLPELNPNDLALIQFSSGSTGDPKGVNLLHRNILLNVQDIIEGIRLTQQDISASWMPLYHDMGLVGFHITPTWTGCRQYFIESADFVKNPTLWLDVMSTQKTTITGCPNFGQLLVNRSLKRKKTGTWDLANLRVVFNAAEPISVGVMQEFLRNLQAYNLKPEAMFPAYGLAEATLAVTFAPLDKEAEVVRFQRIPLLRDGLAVKAEPDEDNAVELVNLGRPLTHCTIRITDEEGNELPNGRIGSVRVHGDNVSPGYYKNPVATRQTLQDGWLHTGDLGFLWNNDLFIMGRSKDIIFMNGINFYAHDLETMIHSVEGVNSGKIVIAGYFDDQEGRDKLLLFLVGSDNELTRTTFLRIKNHLMLTLGLSVDTLIPIKSNDISRTSSGKIQRYKMVHRFLQGEFEGIKG